MPTRIPAFGYIAFALAVTSLASTLLAAPAARKWRDKSGKFEMEAVLLEKTDKEVTLKKADGTTVTVPLDRLSDGDREFLQKEEAAPAARRAAPMPPPPRPRFPATTGSPAENGSPLADDGKVVKLEPGEFPVGLVFDPLPNTSPFPAGSIPTDKVDAYDKISPPVIIDPAKNLVAVSIGRHIINRPEETRGRIFVAAFPAGPAKVAWEVKEKVQLLACDPESDRTALISGIDGLDRGGDLVVLGGLARGEAKEILRRKLPGAGKPGFAPKIDWAVLLDSDYLLAKMDSKLHAWNVVTGKSLYTLDGLQGGHPTLTPGKRYLIVPTRAGASVVNPIDGAVLGYLPSPHEHLVPDVTCHPDGLQVALVAGNQVVAYDISAKEITLSARFGDSISGQPVGWIGDELFATHSGGIFHTDAPVIYWRYEIFASAHAIPTPGGILGATTRDTCYLTSLAIPSPAVASAGKQFGKIMHSLMALRPGAEVALAAESIDGVNKDEVLKNLREAVEQTEWKVTPKADTTLVAIVGRAPAKQLQFQANGPGGQRTETATITPFTTKMEIRRGGQVLWSQQTENLVPPFLILRNGETLQQAVSKFERPNAEFFANLKLPSFIPKAEARFGLGRTTFKDGVWQDQPGPILTAGSTPAGKSAIPVRPKKK